ncbi:TPA: hypothetical protein I7712_03775 [Vibrio vulnificus]|uniref:hypothetical protein n=1 Tax=Vibrio vulnificus TaxID=672 RepID=UPI001A32D78F|nr:hypothetical protein [Vibrio vulnificus]MCG6290076.1 hypothetical protein [Vibrio vulnificus]HAS6151909.1 hypothetical protein [Vibrio vulnificus]HAS8345536.1 hypothetical protein [Vibrio vulnificus]HAS8507683.1 hypothetical protein [Vibrio vulnificus]HDY7475647.1 hypothetical protein [Vibrio vulnificus]
MKFKDLYISRVDRFSVGIEEQLGVYYLSIPVSNGFVDYEEYYEVDSNALEEIARNYNGFLKTVEACRNRKMDHHLLVTPGKKRGNPI